MGLLELFSKKDESIVVKSIVDGVVKPIEKVADPLFSQKALGDGFFIEPASGEVYAPCNATVAMVFPTKHAIGLKLQDGTEMLIHFGLDTVELNGEGFEVFVKEGQKVNPSTLLMKVDLDYIREHAEGDSAIVIFTEVSDGTSLSFDYSGTTVGSDVVTLVKEG